MTRIKINFDEQTKSVTADVTVESETMTGDETLAESTRLMKLALEEARKLTLKKLV
jgi:hypothetical protein